MPPEESFLNLIGLEQPLELKHPSEGVHLCSTAAPGIGFEDVGSMEMDRARRALRIPNEWR